MGAPKIVVVGAGVGGLVAGAILSARGFDVTILERAKQAGGKLRTVEVEGAAVDSGPTVLTMKWVLEAAFARAGGNLAADLELVRASTLARHFWPDGASLDLKADHDASDLGLEPDHRAVAPGEGG